MSFEFTSEQEEMRQQLKKELRKELVALRQIKTMADQFERHVNRLEGRLTMLNTFKAIYDRRSDIYDNSDFDQDWMSDSSVAFPSSESDDTSSDESDTEKGDDANKEDSSVEGGSEGDDSDTGDSDSNESHNGTKYDKNDTPTSQFLQDQEAWLMERHIQWAGGQNIWGSKEKMCRALDMRTAKELQQGKPEGKGNTQLNFDHCRYDTDGYPFGRPFHALSLAFDIYHGHPEKDFKKWVYTKETREILNYMERWFFPLSIETKKSLHENAWRWDDMPDDHIELWNRAFFPDNHEKK